MRTLSVRRYGYGVSETTGQIRPGPIRTAIVEDRPKIREGLAKLIGNTDGFHCTGCFGSMEDALQGIEGDLPDVALVDIGLTSNL